MPHRHISHLLFFLMLLTVPASGDGGFKYQLVKPVPIPRQTAVMWHQEGKETLTIWNTVEAESQEIAWVLPLPAVPDIIQETDPAALRMIRMTAAPTVIAGGSDELGLILKTIPICLLILIGLRMLTVRRRSDTFLLMGCLPWMVLGLSALAFWLHSGMMSGNRGAVVYEKEGSVLLEQTAGSYDTTVISGNSAAAVNTWLAGNGFSVFEGRELMVVEDYLARNWVFFCAKIRTGGKGVKEAHPLTVRFPTAEPVYPMRLTESAGTVPLDLYVIGINPARDPSGRLQVMRVRDFSSPQSLGPVSLTVALSFQQMLRDDAAQRAAVTETDSKLFTYVPAGRDIFLDTLIAGGTKLTHLEATFKPGDDWADIRFEPFDGSGADRQHFTRVALLEQVLSRLGWVLAVIAIGGGLVALAKTEVGRRPHRTWGLSITLLILTGLVYGFLSVPRNVVIVSSDRVISPKDNEAETAYGQFLVWMQKLAGGPPSAQQ